MSSKHARLSPSSSERWSSCTASPKYIDQNASRIPADLGSPDSRLGTDQHEWNEKLLLGKVNLGAIPEQHREWAEMWQTHVESLTTGLGQTFVEARVPLFYSPEERGTVDWAYVMQEPERVLFIRDYKHGIGVPVSPEFNPQLSIYGKSLIDFLKTQGLVFGPADRVSIGIVQPRYRGDEAIKVWETTVAELEEFLEMEIQFAVDLIKADHVEFKPSLEACRWCPAKGFCDTRINDIMGAVPDKVNPLVEFDDLTTFKEIVGSLSDDQVLRLMEKADHLKTLVSDVQEYAYNRAMDGNPVPGTKLVMGREGNRQWTDEAKAERFMRSAGLKADDMFTKSIISLTQAEKLIKGVLKAKPTMDLRLKKLTYRAPAGKSIALESDKRPAVGPATAVLVEEFDDLVGDDEDDDPAA